MMLWPETRSLLHTNSILPFFELFHYSSLIPRSTKFHLGIDSAIILIYHKVTCKNRCSHIPIRTNKLWGSLIFKQNTKSFEIKLTWFIIKIFGIFFLSFSLLRNTMMTVKLVTIPIDDIVPWVMKVVCSMGSLILVSFGVRSYIFSPVHGRYFKM